MGTRYEIEQAVHRNHRRGPDRNETTAGSGIRHSTRISVGKVRVSVAPENSGRSAMTEQQSWKLECFRNSMCHLTKVLEDEFVEAFPLIKEFDTRHAAFDAIAAMQSARDSMMRFLDLLDGVELVKEKKVFDSFRNIF